MTFSKQDMPSPQSCVGSVILSFMALQRMDNDQRAKVLDQFVREGRLLAEDARIMDEQLLQLDLQRLRKAG